METGYFTEENSAEVVKGRIADTTDPRFKEIMTVLIRHLHAAVKEIEPTQEEWFQAIQFLTKRVICAMIGDRNSYCCPMCWECQCW